MPLYDFECTKCKTTFEVACKICEKDEPHPCPDCKSKKTQSVILTAPMIGDAFRMGINPKQKEFKEVLQKIHKRTPGSQLDKMTSI